MSLVILVFGASGSGKSTLMELLQQAGGQYSIHIKGTDRAPRKYDGIEILCLPEVSPDKYDYVYQTYGHRYGIQRDQIDIAIKQNRHHFIVCNDVPTIRAIKRDYGPCVRVVFHYFDAPRSALIKIQNAREISDDEIELRLAKTEALYRSFVEDWELFDAALYNHFGENISELRLRMDKLMERLVAQTGPRLTPEPSLEELVTTFETKIVEAKRLIRRPQEPNYAFILMAMSEDDPGLQDTHASIKRTCEGLGVRAERVDDIQFTGQITEKILSSIEVASLIIADLTYERPNVYFELGFAQAMAKPCILIARQGTVLHFDIQGIKVLFYANLIQLESLLSKAVSAVAQGTTQKA